MEQSIKIKALFYFNIAFLISFSLVAFFNSNYEFLYYTMVMGGLLLLIVLYYEEMRLSEAVMFGLTVTGFLHLIGSSLKIGNLRLYDVWIIPSLLKYDNVVHFIGAFTASFIAYNLIRPYLHKNIRYNKLLLSLLIVLIASGIGAFNEILELGAVIFLGATKQVGDYLNNAFDLVFNLLGSLFACIFVSMDIEQQQKNLVKKKTYFKNRIKSNKIKNKN